MGLRKAKEIQLYTIRNKQGQFLATYYGYNADQAIAKFVQEANHDCNAFRKSGTRCDWSGVTATVEAKR